MRLVNYMIEMGPPLAYGTDCASLDEPATAKDCVLREAYIGRGDIIGSRPPALLVEGMTGAACRLHEIRKDSCESFNGGPVVLRSKAAVIVGGAMLETRQGALPAVLMYSEKENNIVCYVPNCCVSSLEAEFNDAAFNPEAASFPAAVLGDAAPRFMASFREGAMENRKLPVNKMSDFFFTKPGCCTARFGIVPFLSLRNPQSFREFDMVVAALITAQLCVPFAERSLLEHVTEKLIKPRACIVTMFDPSHAQPARTVVTPSQKEMEKMALRPVLAPLAFLIMSTVADTAEDDAGHSISEVAFNLPKEVEGGKPLADAVHKETEHLKKAKAGRPPQADPTLNEPRTLPRLMRGLHLPYEVRHICETGVRGVCLRRAADELFGEEEGPCATRLIAAEISGCTTGPTAIYTLGKIVDPKHALVFVEREDDGRIVSVKMKNSEREYDEVSDSGFRRLVSSPWAKVIICDSHKLSLLVTRDSNYVREYEVVEEKLLAIAAPPEPPPKDNADNAALLGELKAMREQFASMQQAYTNSLAEAAKLQKSQEEAREAVAAVWSDVKAAAARGDSRPQPESRISLSLKRSAEALGAYAKRLCAA
tara:strand:- start:1949 stop:3733 length:1785 start_codon:yes stop_codon:yes gene_type:complete